MFDAMTAPPRLAAALDGRYRIEGSLGEGAAAVVYLATDLKHGRRVALKVLKPEVAASVGGRRFVDEIQTTAALRHPHVLPLFDSGEAAGFSWFVTPWVQGESLKDRLRREGRLDLDDALAIVRDVGSALAYAHDHGIVHRDVKPANVLLGEGGALVADFGVALALSGGGVPGDDPGGDPGGDEVRLTATGMVVGTPVYMSPEQIGEGPVDGRSDLFALGCLLYEMLAGRSPFEADTIAGVVAKIVAAEPVPLRERRPEVPAAVERVVHRALAKDPDDRFPSVGDFLEALAEAVPGAGGGGAGSAGRRRPGTLVAAGVVLVAVAAAGVLGWRAVQRSEARSALVELGVLVDQERWREGYDLAVELERWIPEDSVLQAYFVDVSDVLTVRSEPAGATVHIQPYDPAAGSTASIETLGVTPIVDLRLPRAEHRLRVELDGHVPLERILSAELSREHLVAAEVGRRLEIDAVLQPASLLPEGMLPVPGGEYLLSSPDAPGGSAHRLDDFAIDRFEVTQGAFEEFVEAGGYEDDTLWEGVDPALRRELTDRTGLPGPRGWTRRRPPEGLERHPVSGVSWFEARAFCRWAGKRLPSIYEWEKVARDGRTAVIGVVMPWGQEGAALSLGGRANFNSTGTVPVDAYPFGVSPYGAYGMAGNVREWLANPSPAGRVTAGGSWLGPSYLFSEYTAESPAFTSEGLGFRCAAGSGDSGAGTTIELDGPAPAYVPVDAATFRTFLDYYRYDPVPPRPREAGREETTDWTRERIWIDGQDGDSILVYTWLPKGSEPPFQTVLYVASTGAFAGLSVAEEAEWVIAPVVLAGRAVVAPVLSGMVERPMPDGFRWPEPPTVAFRDLLVLHSTEVRRTVDYVAGRPEFAPGALAYAAFSFGAGSRLALGVVEDRFDAVVLIGGGIDERVKPTLPEADNVNFAPHIRSPTLLINGANDEEHPWETRALPLWNLLTEPKSLELVPGGGHLPPEEARIPTINAFLDRTLGPVRRR